MIDLIMRTEIMNKDNFEDKLFNLLECIDQDFVGANGEEYLWDKAKEEGFESNLDYSISKAKNEHEDVEKIINSVIHSAISGWDSYYKSTEFSVEKIDETYVISVAVVDNN